MIGILGGGLSGLALAHYLKSPSLVIEAEPRLGGLCRTWSKDGFSTDVGGHILFSRNPDDWARVVGLLGENVHERQRMNRIAWGDQFILYPFENHLHRLGPDAACECLCDLMEAPREHSSDFESWALWRFGLGIAERYLLPYTRKLWKRETSELSADWVNRVPSPPLSSIVKGAFGFPVEGHAHQARFWYPKRGGIESLIAAMVPERWIQGNVEAIVQGASYGWSVRTDQGIVRDERGDFRCLVSTVPLPELVGCLHPVPHEVTEAVSKLEALPVRVVMLGVNRPSSYQMTAVYSADPGIIWHRACWANRFSESMAPAGCQSITCEVTARIGSREWNMPEDELVAHCYAGLRKLGLLVPGDQVVTSLVRTERYGYPVPTLETEHARRSVLDFVERELGIRCLGRWGRWEYLNMDECVRGAYALAEELNAT